MRIGEVAKLLDISVETIRYYESEGIVSPNRKEGSKYREYETWDLFYLMECMAYRSMGLSVKDVVAALHHEPRQFMIDKLREQEKELDKEIWDKKLLLDCLKAYERRLDELPYNLGNYWITKRPAYQVLEYTSSQDDEYAPITAEQTLFAAWISKRPFIRSAQFIDVIGKGKIHQGAWVFVVPADMMDLLEIPSDESVYLLPEQICMTTVIDGGQRGELTEEKFEEVLAQIGARGYEVCGQMMASLINRHWEEGRFHRYIEVTAPVKKIPSRG